MPPPVTRPRTPAPGSSRYSAQSCRTALLVRRRPKSGVMPRETHTFSAHVDLGTLTRVDPGQFGAVGGRDRRADRTVALSYTGVVTQTACWEERSQVCDEIRLTLAEVRRRTPSAEPAWGPRGTTPRLTVRGTTAGAPPPPPPPHHTTPHHTTPHHTTPHHTTPHHTTPHHTTPHHTTPHHTTPHHTTPYHIPHCTRRHCVTP